MNVLRKHVLHSTMNGSDKIYSLSLTEKDSEYNVYYANARRGGALKPKLKNKTSLNSHQADTLYEKILKEKLKKGYVVIESHIERDRDAAITEPAKEESIERSDFPIQLLTPIVHTDTEALERYLNHSDFGLQEKADGERRMVVADGGNVRGTNVRGEFINGLPSELFDSLVSKKVVLDGEMVGNDFIAFDVLSLDGENLMNKPFLERYQRLCDFAEYNLHIHVSKLHLCADSKRKTLEALRDRGSEGVVLKRLSAKHSEGRGKDQFKYKFYKECSVVVAGVNDKRSVAIAVIDESGTQVSVGNVTIPPNKNIPKTGDVIEVRYLYAYRKGSLYQPTLLKNRPDQILTDCSISQLQYKNESAKQSHKSYWAAL